MLNQIRPITDPIVHKLAKPISFINPNVITWASLIFPLLFLFSFIQGQYFIALVAFLGNFFDALDGAIARVSRKESSFGAFLDSTLDRVADIIYISAFGFAGILAWEPVILAISASVLTSYARARAEGAHEKKIKLDIGILERGERLILIFLATFAVALEQDTIAQILIWAIAMLGTVTLFQRIYLASKVLS